MIYLTVPPARSAWVVMASAGIGIVRTPATAPNLETVAAFPCWLADNGCYAQGERFRLDTYLEWLAAMSPARNTCLFATAPDVVGDAAATWERSREVLPQIRALGYPAALVAQDGWDSAVVDWGAFDCLFIGGTDAFKREAVATDLLREARRRGTWTHYGRCNSWRRIEVAMLAGCDSADGTTVAYNTERYVPEVTRWGHRLRMQRLLWDVPR